ncbi:TPA: hypothetical protein QDZ34_003854 [Stenotrophomonas maltophilia]|nr:hypothetical protein [Stenotrophomonas maltophilia]HDS1025410.1 hypothetical protein [Stenotrophomonas maltophilia]HDS1031825.1 hypothetical protein [Stenotrophomonas maltophilia]HDS1036459.1 hypothetical protein [Stenotrophomonas maltophilia]HDS1038771.1 hypothetical protein [Stenotrophomonas maltophilia]
MLRTALPLLLASTAGAAPLDLPALIECRQGVAEHAALAPLLADPLKAVAQGLQPLPQGNPFMSEYRLATPITVFGQPTERIAIAGASVMAVLDQADPRPLAKRLALETGYDQDGKFMAGRELVSRDVTDPGTGEAQIESIILSVSTVATHPGKTLAGCTYSLDLPAEGEAPAPTPDSH